VSELAFAGVWKSFPAWDAGSRTLRGLVGRRVPALRGGQARRWALQDVTLTVAAGESVGLVGHNGAGKSTLLRLGSGLGRPTRGTVRTPPGTVAVLALGESFDLSLSGAENAVTAALVAGVPERRARDLLPEVLAFAELEAFAEMPVRAYSSGMRLRLAFGVVAQLRPAALLLDEVLAVGDAHFQAKCLERVHAFRAGGASLLLASHDLAQVAGECDRAVWLEHGRVREEGPAADVVEAYRTAALRETHERTPAPGPGDDPALVPGETRFGDREVELAAVQLNGRPAVEGATVQAGGALTIACELSARTDVREVIVGASVQTTEGLILIDVNTALDGVRVDLGLDGRAEVAVDLEPLELAPGRYWLEVGVYEASFGHAHDLHTHAYHVDVEGRRQGEGLLRARRRWRQG
jgi:lipopolysaccharide transport system ATP-binding protein